MTEKSSSMVRLDAHQNDNWTSRAVPVAILNTESTLHDRIAYCWGLAKNLHVLSFNLNQHSNSEVREVAFLFGCQLQPLEVMLEKMGSDTNPSLNSKPDAKKSCPSDKDASTDGEGADGGGAVEQ